MRVHSSRLALALVFGVVFLGRDPASAGETPPPSSSTAHHFLLPIGNGRKLFAHADTASSSVLGFWAARGRDWNIYWDSVLDTPRFAAPLTAVLIADPTPVAGEPVPALTQSIEAFIDLNQSFLGVSSERLGEPYVYTLLGDWVYVFPQTTLGGIPIRGACLRVVVNESGRLRWIKAFVARNVPEIGGELLSEAAAKAKIDLQAAEVLSADLEIGFETDRIESARAVWSLWIRGADEDETELILDATDGAPLTHRSIVKYFDGQGGGDGGAGGAKEFEHSGIVVGSYPLRTDFFASVWITPPVEQGVPKVTIRDADHELRTETMTDLEGKFEVTSPELPHTLNADLETTWFGVEGRGKMLSLKPRQGARYVSIPGSDEDYDFTPDLNQTHNGPVVQYKLFDSSLFNRPGPRPVTATPEEIAWWLQTFDFASDQIQRAGAILSFALVGSGKGMDRATFLPFAQAELHATDSPGGEHTYQRRYNGRGLISAGIGTLFPAPGMGPTHEGVSVPTFVQHEVGHHLFHSITNTTLPRNRDLFSPNDHVVEALEESIANALAAIHNDDERVGFVKLANKSIVPTARAVDLSVPPPRKGELKERIQAEYQAAFWALHALLRAEEKNPFRPKVDSVEGLILVWLGFNRVGRYTERNFDNTYNLADELALAVDTPPFGGDNDLSDGVPFQSQIQTAFQDVVLFDTLFQRGNPNRDARVDLSDAVYVLAFLFQGGGPFHDCLNSMDADNNGSVELTDAVRILQHLFLGGAPLDYPFLECGLDPEGPGLPGNAGCREPWCPQ